MDKRTKRRLIIVTLLIVAIAVVVLAVVGSGSASASVSVSQAASGDYDGKRVQVSGTVVNDSYENTGDGLSFDIYDPENEGAIIHVDYTGAVPASFGNGVTAICTGTMEGGTRVVAGELLTKCPSKYESAEGALTVTMILDNADIYDGQDVKLAGYIKEDTLVPVGTDDGRFVLYSQDDEIVVEYDGAIPDGVGEGSSVVLTGRLNDGRFVATDLAEQQL